MPHHSAHKRPQVNGFGSGNPMMGTSPSFPPHGAPFGPTADLRMMRGSSWSTSSPHRVEHGERGEATPTRSLPSSASRSFDSPHEVAASVLLLAARVTREKELKAEAEANEEYGRNVPLKKRKNAADIMRKKHDDAFCHVSPHSETSEHIDSRVGASSAPPDAATATPSSSRQTSTGGSPMSSYDLKNSQALPDSAKVNDTKDITPPSHVEIPHFPSVLHAVLTESEFAGKVLMWLPHGQSWKIVRWDALRRQVLPKYFSQLREEDSKDGSASIDAFLWHLSAWGFEEVTDGPDVGAYSHVLFRRELSRLCREMRFAPSDGKEPVDADMHHADHGARSILQVPSLASTPGGSVHSGRSIMDEEKKEDGMTYSNLGPQGWPNRQVFGGTLPVGYRPENTASGEAWKYFSESPKWIGTPANTQQRAMPPYSPIRVRSGRGAARLPLSRTAMLDSSPPTAPRSTFPVSNRGKGNANRARRISIPTTTAIDSPKAEETTAATGVAKPSPSQGPRPILKRKLPMMTRKPSTGEESVESTVKVPKLATKKSEDSESTSTASDDDSDTSSDNTPESK